MRAAARHRLRRLMLVGVKALWSLDRHVHDTPLASQLELMGLRHRLRTRQRGVKCTGLEMADTRDIKCRQDT